MSFTCCVKHYNIGNASIARDWLMSVEDVIIMAGFIGTTAEFGYRMRFTLTILRLYV